MTDKQLIMYSRTASCPFVTTARRVLEEHGVPYREILIDQDPDARQRVLRWTGFLSVPTLVVADPGELTPYTSFTPLPAGKSPRAVDRGPMLTEPGSRQLEEWLHRHGFIDHLADDTTRAADEEETAS